MKRYELLCCSVCNKQEKRLINLKQVGIYRCNLTAGCLGSLAASEDTNSLEPFVEKMAPSVSQQISFSDVILTSGDGIISLAAPENVTSKNLTAEQFSTSAIIEYLFKLKSGANSIFGADFNRRVLRYSNDDAIFISVNGDTVQKHSGKYSFKTSVDGTGSNIITFDNALDSDVEVVVSVTKISNKSTISLNFINNANLTNVYGAWSNVKSFKTIHNGTEIELFVYTCDLKTAGLWPNTKFKFTGNFSVQMGALSAVGLTPAAMEPKILLSNGGNSLFCDRQLDMWASPSSVELAQLVSGEIDVIHASVAVEEEYHPILDITFASGEYEQFTLSGKDIGFRTEFKGLKSHFRI